MLLMRRNSAASTHDTCGGSGGGDYYGTDGVETAEASDAQNGSEGFKVDHVGDDEVSVVNLVSNVRQWLSMLKSDTSEQS